MSISKVTGQIHSGVSPATPDIRGNEPASENAPPAGHWADGAGSRIAGITLAHLSPGTVAHAACAMARMHSLASPLPRETAEPLQLPPYLENLVSDQNRLPAMAPIDFSNLGRSAFAASADCARELLQQHA